MWHNPKETTIMFNHSILLPRRIRRNPGWLTRFTRFVSDYRFFRLLGYCRRAAWSMARNTL